MRKTHLAHLLQQITPAPTAMLAVGYTDEEDRIEILSDNIAAIGLYKIETHAGTADCAEGITDAEAEPCDVLATETTTRPLVLDLSMDGGGVYAPADDEAGGMFNYLGLDLVSTFTPERWMEMAQAAQRRRVRRDLTLQNVHAGLFATNGRGGWTGWVDDLGPRWTKVTLDELRASVSGSTDYYVQKILTSPPAIALDWARRQGVRWPLKATAK